ncbi:MAG: ADP-ribosylglycohydrolase family protein [Anaerolineales bacterium]
MAGCLAGLALGDALGTVTQPTPEATRARYGLITSFLAPHPDDEFGHAGLRAGQITDDTQAALALVEAVIREQTFSPEVAARALVHWLDSIDAAHSPYVGPSTKAAYAALKRGVPVTESGLGGATNGAAMRVAPLGFLSTDLETIARYAVWSAMPTHHTPIGFASAAAVACAVLPSPSGRGAGGEGDLANIIVAACLGATLGAQQYAGPQPFASQPDLARRIRWAVNLVRECPPVSRDPYDWPDGVWQTLRDLYDLSGAGMAAYETVPTALALIVLANGDPLTATLLAANLGGDGDTIGAIAGAVCGAYSGIDSIPSEMVATLESVNQLNFRRLAHDSVQAIRRYRIELRE